MSEYLLAFAEEYEFDNPLVHKIDSIIDKCYRDCHKNFFHTYIHTYIYI